MGCFITFSVMSAAAMRMLFNSTWSTRLNGFILPLGEHSSSGLLYFATENDWCNTPKLVGDVIEQPLELLLIIIMITSSHCVLNVTGYSLSVLSTSANRSFCCRTKYLGSNYTQNYLRYAGYIQDTNFLGLLMQSMTLCLISFTGIYM